MYWFSSSKLKMLQYISGLEDSLFGYHLTLNFHRTKISFSAFAIWGIRRHLIFENDSVEGGYSEYASFWNFPKWTIIT